MACHQARRASSGLYLESTRAEQLGVLPGEERLVRDIMNRNPLCISPSMSLREALEIMQRVGTDVLIVREGARLHGLVTERDVATRTTLEGADFADLSRTVGETLGIQAVVTCCEYDVVADVMILFEDRRVPVIPVLNDDEFVTGMVAPADLAASMLPDQAKKWLTHITLAA